MIIGVDFDNVLFPTMHAVIDLYNKKYNDNLKLEDITTYNFYECLDSEVANKLINLFIDKGCAEVIKFKYLIFWR